MEIYLETIEALEGSPEMDDELGLYNKVGDLYLKIHNVNAAVDMYERAVNRYTASGFPNNAIALCNKILRSAPGRTHIYLKLAQLMLQRGFVAEAKKNFVEYAQRMSDAGKLDEAFSALKRFAELSPENQEIRAMLAEQLRSAARDDAARAEIDRMMAGAESEEAATEGELQVDPEYDLDNAQAKPATGKSEDLVFIPLDDEPDAGATQPREPVADLETTQPMEPMEEPLPALEIETTSLAEEPETPVVEGGGVEIERASTESGFEAPGETIAAVDGLEVGSGFEGTDDVPTLELTELVEVEEAAESEPSPASVADEAVGGDLELIQPDDVSADPFAATADPSRQAPVEPGLGVDTAAAEPGFVDLAEPEPTPRESVHSLEARVAAAPDDGLLRRDFGEALVESGQRDRGLAELDAAGRSFEAHEDWPHAASVCDLILRLEPNSIPHHQKRVEYAYRLGERGQLINAYLELADALFRSGSLDNAKAIYERVLEHDPGNRRAGDALATIAPPEPAGAAPKGEYVDLGELILEDTTDKDTRMRIEQDEPSGNEQQDFQEMLQQFKRGIEENLDEEDSQAHYDLGVAFKEMGLLDEAIGEFQKALRRPDTRLQSAEMLGHCFLEKGQLEVAATVFRRAVEGDPSSDQEKIGLLYWLARCEEDRARPAEALKFYRRVFAVDVNFSDVQQRVNALVQTEG